MKFAHFSVAPFDTKANIDAHIAAFHYFWWKNTVDYVKHQFLDGRIYYGLDILNQEFNDWLDRDGNGMINNTTKKSPRELFKKEYPKLQKYYEKKKDELVVHSVYHDTVVYRDNLYKLPTRQINEGDRIRIERHDDLLFFYLACTSKLLCKHRLVFGIGNTIPLDIETKEETTIEEVLLTEYKDSESAIKYLKRL